jgi:hypothetical protein
MGRAFTYSPQITQILMRDFTEWETFSVISHEDPCNLWTQEPHACVARELRAPFSR